MTRVQSPIHSARCSTFDAKANGFFLVEGRRMSSCYGASQTAVRDGDPVRAVVRRSAHKQLQPDARHY
jgi:acyl transferase domain-containing protein